MTGIYDCFGYDVPFKERYRLIKAAGFESVMLWWSDKFGRGEGYREDAGFAKEAGLFIENMHAPVHLQNAVSFDNSDGESAFESYLGCIGDCTEYGVPAVVIHIPSDSFPINKLGVKRFEKIAAKAESTGVKVAFENLDNIQNLSLVLSSIQSENVGFCYDSCHHMNFAPHTDLLKEYGSRLIAIHLQDNGGINNQHQLPFDGNVNWENVVKKLAQTEYTGNITLEPMNWDYQDITIKEFLKRAHQKAKQLEIMYKEAKQKR